MEFSQAEAALLREIQSDCNQSLAELSEKVGMAQSTLWRKLQDFEEMGLIRGRVAMLDPALAGSKLCVLASVSLKRHSEEAIASLERLVATHPEILECHAVSGVADYQMKIRVADVEAYEQFMTHNLLRNAHVQSVQSSFVLKELKDTTALPI